MEGTGSLQEGAESPLCWPRTREQSSGLGMDPESLWALWWPWETSAAGLPVATRGLEAHTLTDGGLDS